MDDAGDDDDELVVVVPAAHQAGVWANSATVDVGDHEITLDFIRVDGSIDPNVGTVVARIAMSPKLLGQLVDRLGATWDAYAAEVTEALLEAPPPPEDDDD